MSRAVWKWGSCAEDEVLLGVMSCVVARSFPPRSCCQNNCWIRLFTAREGSRVGCGWIPHLDPSRERHRDPLHTARSRPDLCGDREPWHAVSASFGPDRRDARTHRDCGLLQALARRRDADSRTITNVRGKEATITILPHFVGLLLEASISTSYCADVAMSVTV